MEGVSPLGYICLAVYRPDVALLRRQIESLRAQTVTQWRCLVGIDGLDTDARQAVEGIVAEDQRFEIHEYPANVGFYRNFERILEAVPEDAAWVALSDQDDEWFPHKLETLIPALDGASLSMGQAIVTDGDGSGPGIPTERRVVPLSAALIDNQVTGSACMFRRDLLDVALPFPPATDLAFHDHWLGVCAIVAEGVVVVDQPLQYYLQHAANVIGEEQGRSLSSRMRALVGRSGGGVGNAIRYLAEHRWGWRVNMARALRDRAVQLRDNDAAVVDAYADGKARPGLLATMLAAVVRRQAPAARAGGLLIGALRGVGAPEVR